MGKLILLNAPPRAGKDTAAELACQKLANFLRVSRFVRFSTPLKHATHAAFGLEVGEFHYENVKDIPSEDFFGSTPREAYIVTAEQHFKKVYGRDFFGHIFVRRAERIYGPTTVQPHLLVPDSGFPEETEVAASAYGKHNCLILRIERPGCDFSRDSRGHFALSGVTTFTVQNAGTIEEFEHEISNAICEFITGKTLEQFIGRGRDRAAGI